METDHDQHYFRKWWFRRPAVFLLHVLKVNLKWRNWLGIWIALKQVVYISLMESHCFIYQESDNFLVVISTSPP